MRQGLFEVLRVKYGIVVPVYNHGKPAYYETETLIGFGYPVILVNDGSLDDTKAWLEKAKGLSSLVTVVTLDKNSGKGGALKAGFKTAQEMGLSHVLQVDADGQHDLSRIPHFIALSEENPDAQIIGYPEYDDTVPESRKEGRKIANNSCAVALLSRTAVKDAMCGFRVYPVDKAVEVLSHGIFDLRMGFDIEIVVKLYRKGVRVVNESVKVTYPEGGTSNFHMVRDNVRISLVFTRLICTVPFHLPTLLSMRRKG